MINDIVLSGDKNEDQIHTGTENGFQEIPFLSDIGLAITYHCQSSCLHCIVEAGPKRREFIPLHDVHSWLKQISNYNNRQIKAIAITGGEPFSNLEYLTSIVKKAFSLSLLVTAVSNAYWATSYETALSILKNLPEISVLTFSTDIYHQRVIPLQRIKNAIRAAQELGRRYSIAVCVGSEMDDATINTLKYLSEFAPLEVINTANIFPVGRARTLVECKNYPFSTIPPKAACSMAHAPVILVDGSVIACFGPIIGIKSDHPLYLGNLYKESLSDILDRAEMNPILHIIRVWGPYKLIEMVKKEGFRDCLPDKYVTDSICCICYDFFKELPQNEKLKVFLDKLKKDLEFLELIGYGRVFYLKEMHMAGMLYINKSIE